MERPLAPRRVLSHPLWLWALTLLILNDHFFKGSGRLPAVLTGKLSDFAGLLVAPALLVVLLRRSSRRSLVLAHVATGAVFAAIKISPAFARFFESLAGLGPFSWHITVDPTDLIALPMLFVSYRVFGAAMARPTVERPNLQRGLVMAGSVACMATSQEGPPPCVDPIACGAIPRESASLVIGNDTDTQRLVRVRPLKESVQVLCNELLTDPTKTLSRELFASAEAWLLEPSRGLPLVRRNNAGDCAAYLIDADGMPPTLVAWSALEFPDNFLSTSTLSPDGNTMILMGLDDSGKLALDSAHPAVFDAPALEEPQPTGVCAPAEPGVGVAWSTPLPGMGPFKIADIQSSPDDCHLLVLENSPSLYVCIPAAAMPFQVGDTLEVESLLLGGGSFAETANEAPSADMLILRTATHIVVISRGNVLARYGQSGAAEQLTEPTVEIDRTKGCAGSHDACGSLVIPAEITYMGDHVDTISFLRSGTSLALKDGYGTLHVVRAEAMPIRDTSCAPFPRGSQHYESVLVIPTIP